MRIELGPYDLVEPVGRGGMATVWRGELRNERLPVAVKVLDAQHLRDPGFRAWFASEVRVMASLDHPHIARIYDQGVVQASSDRRLPLGAPYMVMEWASGGRLELGRIGSWAPLRSLLIDLLDALAHAHARGVVHRDLKPSNITVCTEADPRPGIKLVDFGVAHVVEHEALELDDSGEQQLFGTPRFMAPEQVMRDFRALGPWTDLYALGCLAFAAANGNTLTVAEANTLGEAELDHVRLHQCLMQLVSNAAKFTRNGAIRVTATRTPDDLVFEVRDNGIGIPAEKQARIFDPFMQVEADAARRYEGSGLGLTLVQRLAKLMGGDIACESAVGAGSTFTLRVSANQMQ